MDINSRDPSQNIIPFRILGNEIARFDQDGNLGIGTSVPSAKLDVVGSIKLTGVATISGGLTLNGRNIEDKTTVVVNMDSQISSTALNKQKKQSIPLYEPTILRTSDIIAKMNGVSVGKTQSYGVGAAQTASYGNIVVAVGSGTNSIAYSLANPPTASSWVGIPNSANTFTGQGWNITYANGTWVAVGEGTNSIAYSTMTPPIASSWVGIPSSNQQPIINTFTTRARDITYGNGAWVAVGDGTNTISYSLANPPTAESWVGIPISYSPTIFGNIGCSITFGNGTWVAVGNGTNGIVYSTRTPPTTDSWVVVPLNNVNDAGASNTITSTAFNVIYSNGVWLAAGNGTNTLCYSIENPPIAGSWIPILNSVLFGSWGRSIAYGNGTWVACGEASTLMAYSTSIIPHSGSWVSLKGPTPSSSGETINHVGFNSSTNTWYFLGDIANNSLFYSTTTPPVPATWIGIPRSSGTFSTQAFGAAMTTTPAFTTPINVARLDNKVTFPANRMIAVGGGGGDSGTMMSGSGGVGGTIVGNRSGAIMNSITYSDDDGATWQMVPGGASNYMFSSPTDISAGISFGVGGTRGANDIAWNGERWVAAGNGRTNSLAFSDDGGMTWNGITGKSIFSVEARSVAWNGKMWVAVGRGSIFSTAYSYDGVTWIGPTDSSGNTVNVFTFDNSAVPLALTSDISGGGNHVLWNGKMWIATGTRTLIANSNPAAYYTMAYSYDGKAWTGISDTGSSSNGFDVYSYGIAWNGRNFIATGRGTSNTLAFSTDGINWMGLGNTVFSVWGRGITWGGGGSKGNTGNARRWVATGSGTNTIAFSTNGRNWQGCGVKVFKPVRRFMAIGDTGLYTGVVSGQPQRGVAFSYSDDGITWDAPIVNQTLEFSAPFGTSDDTVRSVIYTTQMFLTNAITDNASNHQSLMYSTDAGASWSRVPGSSDTEANGGTGMTNGNRGCYSIVANPTRTRFIAGGGDSASATRKVYFSNDGFNWNRSGSSLNTSPQMAWVWASLWVGGGYNRWLIGGSDASTSNSYGRIMYSGDADAAVAAWSTASPTTFTSTIISCFAANTDFSVILAGATSGNTIYRAANNGGTTWTSVSISSTPIGSIRSIAFSPSLGRWVAVGGGGGSANTIIYSTDATGTAWIAPPIQAKAAATAIFKNGSEATRVIWDAVGARFIIGGWNGATDFTSLTNMAASSFNGTNNNTGYTMAYSPDGINWTPINVRNSDGTAIPGSPGPFITRCREIMALDISGEYTPINTGYSVTWNSYANRFVATGNGTTPIVVSNDGGVSWEPAVQQPQQQAIAVAVGTHSSFISPITYTIDGENWSHGLGAKDVFSGASVAAFCVKYGQTSTAISPNGRLWVVGGGNTVSSQSGSFSLAISQNGVRWTGIVSSKTLIGNVRAVAYAPAEQLGGNAAITANSGVGNGVWVAGGDVTNSLVFSYDGVSWSEVPNSLTILTRCNACTFANGLFIAGGTAGSLDSTSNMAYSRDGIVWKNIPATATRINSAASILSIAYGKDENDRGLWMAGASFTTNTTPTTALFYSYNGIDWIAVLSSSVALSTNVSSIAYGVNTTTGRGLWMASVFTTAGLSYSFISSPTGRDNWGSIANTKTTLFNGSGASSTGIAYMNGVWYATGIASGLSTGRSLAYSYDGSGAWFGVYPGTNLYGPGTNYTQTYDLSMYGVATINDYMMPANITPIRASAWTAGMGSAYLQHQTLAFGTNGTGRNMTAFSADGGRTWGASMANSQMISTTGLVGNTVFNGACRDAIWNGSIWVAVGLDNITGAKVATSKDGITWTQIPAANIPINGGVNAIMWNGAIWVIGGDGTALLSSPPVISRPNPTIAYSSDAINWTGVSNTDTKIANVKRVAWNGASWVAVGDSVSGLSNSTIIYSKNGLTWTDVIDNSSIDGNRSASLFASATDVVWGGGRWVAVGQSISSRNGFTIMYSVDYDYNGSRAAADNAYTGARWAGVVGSNNLFPFGAKSVSWNGKRFVATGQAYSSSSTGNIIAWSPDGIAWTAYSSTKTIAPGQRWIAVGSGSIATIATSGDGKTWTDVSGSALLFPDLSGALPDAAAAAGTGARSIGWNGSSLLVGGARNSSAAPRTTIPIYAFIGSGINPAFGTTPYSSVFTSHLDISNSMWMNTYTDLSATTLFQITPDQQQFSSAIKWNGYAWVANFGLTTYDISGIQYGTIWYSTDPLARVGWSVASNYASPRILVGQGGYAGLEWNGVAWLACGYDPNNNNLIYTTDKYGATGWTAVSGIVSSRTSSFQPICIAKNDRYWVVGGRMGTQSAIFYTSDRTGATGWTMVDTNVGVGGGGSILPSSRITSIAYNGTSWLCCGGTGVSWRADDGTGFADLRTGWAAATGTFPTTMETCSAIAYNYSSSSPAWVVLGDAISGPTLISYSTTINGASGWIQSTGTISAASIGKLNGLIWNGTSWIATSGGGNSLLVTTGNINGDAQWNRASPQYNLLNTTPTLCTNAIAFANIPISLLTTGMVSSDGVGAGSGALYRASVGRAQGLLGNEATSVVVRSSNGAEATNWSHTFSKNFMVAVGGGVIRDASGNGGTNRMAYSYDGGVTWTANNTTIMTTAGNAAVGAIRCVKYSNGIWVAGGDSAGSDSARGTTCLAYSRDGVNWVSAGGTQIFGSAGACYAVCCNDRGRWVAVGGASLSTPGTYTNTSGAIYTMAWSDDGINWTPVLGSRALFNIVCQGVSYGADASGVGMWTAIGRGSGYTGLAYSYDGKNWFLSQTSSSLFGTSANVLTERYSPITTGYWYAISISATGQYQSAAGMSGYIYTSSDYGLSWTARITDTTRSWVGIAVSSNGQYQSACINGGYVYTSSDYGVTWTARTQYSKYWFSIAMSSTGQYQITCDYNNGEYIYTSSDYGVTWMPRTQYTGYWWCVSVSATGQYQSAANYNAGSGTYIYTSSDYGVTWNQRTQFSRNWSSISLSSTGQYQTAGDMGGNYIATSSDYGVTWTQRTQYSGAWKSVAVSSTGQYQSAVINSGGSGAYIYTSSDYGATWVQRTQYNLSWYSIAVSATGQYQTAGHNGGLLYISSNFGVTWSPSSVDSRSLGIAYGKDASGAGMWVATAGRRDRDVAASAANTMAYSYDGKSWRGITASACMSNQAWSVAYGKDGFGAGMWVAAGYDSTCGLKWSYDGITWNSTLGASGSAVWASSTAGRRAISVYWNGSMWFASTSDLRNGELITLGATSGATGYLLYSYNGKNWLPVISPTPFNSTSTMSVYSTLPNPVILDFGSFYDDQIQRGTTIANTKAGSIGSVNANIPPKNVNTIVPYGRGSLATGQVPFIMGGDSGLIDSASSLSLSGTSGGPPITSEIAATTTSLAVSLDGGISWRPVPNSTKIMTKVNKILCDENTQQIVAVGTGNYSVAISTPTTAANSDGWTGVFGSRMTNTKTGLFDNYGTGAAWFSAAKMWIACGRVRSKRGSSLAVSVNGTVWQDAKIMTRGVAGSGTVAMAGKGGGLMTATTSSSRSTTNIPYNFNLYNFTSHNFSTAGTTGRTGPSLSAVRSAYSGVSWAQDTTNNYLNMTTNGYQLWKVPTTGNYTIIIAGAPGTDVVGVKSGGRGGIVSMSVALTQGHQIGIIVGQKGIGPTSQSGNAGGAGGGGSFVWNASNGNALIGAAGGGGGACLWSGYSYSGGDAILSSTTGGSTNGNQSITGGVNGAGGNITSGYTSYGTGSGGGWVSAGTGNNNNSVNYGGQTFGNGFIGGDSYQAPYWSGYGGFGGGGGSNQVCGSGGGGYSGGGSAGASNPNEIAGGGGGSCYLSGTNQTQLGYNTGDGYVTITLTTIIKDAVLIVPNSTSTSFSSSVIPYTSPTTSLLTYTDSAAAFSTQVSSVAVNSQYNRAVVGGSSIQFVAGGRSGGAGAGAGDISNNLSYSYDGVNWTPISYSSGLAGSGSGSIFQTPTNVATYTGAGTSSGFDASFGTTALTQRMIQISSGPAYLACPFRTVAVSGSGQYQIAGTNTGTNGGVIYTSNDYGNTWQQITSAALTNSQYFAAAISATGQYQTVGIVGGNIKRSSDYGKTWSDISTGYYWYSLSMSASGQYQTGAAYNNAVLALSKDYGLTWAFIGGYNGIWSVSVSTTGQYQSMACISNYQIRTSSDYGQTWVIRDSGREWRSISISSTGQIQTAVVYSTSTGGYIYTSLDFGFSWGARLVDVNRNWYGVSVSGTGQYQTAIVSGGWIYTSSDYGITWIARLTDVNRGWISISISTSGQYQTAVVENENIYTSTDFGVTWVKKSTSTITNAFTRIKSSASGQYQIATSGPYGNNNGQFYVSSDYGNTWIPRRGLGSWFGGAVSGIGAVMMGGGLSLDSVEAKTIPDFYGTYGTMTSARAFTLSGWSLYASVDTYSNEGLCNLLTGSTSQPAGFLVDKVTIGLNAPFVYKIDTITWDVYSSQGSRKAKDYRIYGSNTSYLGNLTSALVSSNATLLASGTFASGTGSNLITLTNSSFYSSYYFDVLNNYGDSSIKVYRITINSANRVNTAGSLPLMRSIDYGNTFSDISGTTLTSGYWKSIALTNSGTVQTAVAYGGGIYRSSDTGATWSNSGITIDGSANANTVTPRNWQDVAISAETGLTQITCVSGGYLYVSNNNGVNWTSSLVVIDNSGQVINRGWQGVAVSANGQYGLACANSANTNAVSTITVPNWINYNKNTLYSPLSSSNLNTNVGTTTSLINTNNYTYIQSLLGLTNMSQLKLQYKASIDGMTPNAFHSKVANIAPLFVVIKNTAGYIATAYSTVAYSDTSDGSTGFTWRYAPAGNCWVNNLFNPTGTGSYSSTKYTNQTSLSGSMYDHKDYGLRVGGSPTIGIGPGNGPTVTFTTIQSMAAGPYTGATGTILFGANETTLADFECYSIEAVDLTYKAAYSEAANQQSLLINSSNISYVKQLLTDSSNNDTPQLKLIWKSTVASDGWSSTDWHTRVNGITPLLVVIKSTTGYITTAYISIPYTTSNQGWLPTTAGVAIEFSSWINPFYNPTTGYSTVKYGNNAGSQYVIWDNNAGLVIGDGNTIGIYNPMNNPAGNVHYSAPAGGVFATLKYPSNAPSITNTTLFGSYYFTPSEIECYMITIPNTVTVGRYGTPNWFPLTRPIFSTGDNINSPVNAFKLMASTNIDGGAGPGALITDLSQLKLIYRLSSEFDKKATTWYNIVSGVTQMLIVIKTSNGYVFTTYTGGQNFSGTPVWKYPSLNELFVSRFRDSSFTFSTTKYKNISTTNIILSAANYGPYFNAAYYMTIANANTSTSIFTNDTIINNFSTGIWESGFTNTTLWGTSGNVAITELECYSFTGGSGAGIAFDSVSSTYFPMYSTLKSVASESSSGGLLYRSTNFGASWASSNIVIDGSLTQSSYRVWQDVGMSSSGKYQVACLNSNTSAAATTILPSTVNLMTTPPGALTTTFGTSWTQRGGDIDGEAVGDQSGYSVSMSADGTVVAIGAPMNYGANGRESGQVRVYAWNGSAWTQRGADIDGEAGMSSLPMVVTASGTFTESQIFGVSMSSSGQYQTAVGWQRLIRVSSDFGVNWVQKGDGILYSGVSVSSTGQYQTATVSNETFNAGKIMISSDFGMNWISKAGNLNWYGVSISSSGQYQTAFVLNGQIWISSDFGMNWAAKASSYYWNGISISSSGQYQTAVVRNGQIWISSDFGMNWVAKASSVNWNSVSVSSSGQYQSATVFGGQIWISSDFGMNWAAKASSLNWYRVTISSSGQYQTAIVGIGLIWISSDFGMNWVSKASSGNWSNCYVSSSGQYQIAYDYNNYMYFSRDYGFNWSIYASYEITTGDRSGSSVNLSADGTVVAIGAPYNDGSSILDRGQVRVYAWNGSAWSARGSNIMYGEASNDYSGMSVSLSKDGKIVAIGAPFNDGATGRDSGQARVYAWDGSAWAQRGSDIDGEFGVTTANRVVTAATSVARSWYSVALSATGQYQSAVVYGGGIYISSNYGVDWSLVPSVNGASTSGNWFSISLSSTGQYQSAVISGGGIYTSYNFGVTWSLVPAANGAPTNNYWAVISLSSTGQYQLACAGEGVYKSNNYGISWSIAAGSNRWRGVSVSSTGQYQAAANQYGGYGIYISSNYGSSWSISGATTSADWTDVAISSTGQYLTAIAEYSAGLGTGGIYVSSDFGISWSQVSSGNGAPTTLPIGSRVALSSTGQYQSACSISGNIYVSSDFGKSWISRTLSSTWREISVSSTGQYQSACINGDYIRVSRDYGFTWSEYASYEITDGDQSGYSVSLSADGSALAVCAINNDSASGIDRGHVRVYTWSGSAWSQRGTDIDGEGPNDNSGYSVSMSADGTIMAVGAPYNNGANGVGSGHVRVYVWNGTVWSQRGADIDGETGVTIPTVVSASGTSGSRSWYSIAMSSTGQYQIANTWGGGWYISSNYGVNFTLIPSGNAPPNTSSRGIGISSSGQYQNTVSDPGGIYTSSNFGVNWTLVSAANGVPTTASQWYGISMSSTGQYQTAISNNSSAIYISSNFGVTWSLVSSANGGAPSNSVMGISISSTGQYQTVAVNIGGLLTSSNYGNNWTQRMGGLDFYHISISSTGQYQCGLVSNGSIYISSNFGINWSAVSSGNGGPASANWQGLSISSTGQYQSATAWTAGIYTSSNFGVTWSLVPTANGAPTNANWRKIAISSSGQYQTAVVSDSLIYFSRDYGFTWSTTASYELTTGGDQSGYSVSLSADGNTLAIGAPYNDGSSGVDRGHVRIYGWSGTAWTQRGGDIDGEAVNDWSGWSVSLSSDGASVAIGSPLNDGASQLSSNSGSVRIYKVDVSNSITYTSSSSSVADICGNIMLIKGTNGTSNIVATQGSTIINGTLTVSGTTYTLIYSGSGGNSSFIYYSKDYGATWASLPAAGSRAWSSIALSANGSTISATTIADVSGSVWTYTMPDEQYRRPPAITNGNNATTSATVRAIAYGNSGTGAAVDGYWVAGADAATNSLAYSSNGIDWTPVVGSKTTLFNAVNGVAYGADLSGTYMWIAVGTPFIGSIPYAPGIANSGTAYSIAYSYNMTTWTPIRNSNNFTGQGNHVAYGQDESGNGIWVAVGQGDGVSPTTDISGNQLNGAASNTIYYSYDGIRWCAGSGSGVFAKAGNDVTWGTDAAGVSTWVATGIGYTDVTTGAYIPGGQIAYSLNGRVWTPITNPAGSGSSPFSISGLCVAYGRSGANGTGIAQWIVGGSGTNFICYASQPSSYTNGTWTSLSSTSAFAPFTVGGASNVCSTIAYSNGIWVAGNNTDLSNAIAYSTNGGQTWTGVARDIATSFTGGCAALAANAFSNFSLAYADYSNDTNLRTWVSIPGTKNLMFENGVNSIATATLPSSVNVSSYTNRAWWVAVGQGQNNKAALAFNYNSDPSGVSGVGWTLGTNGTSGGSTGITDLSVLNCVAFSPQTLRWLAVGNGTSTTPTRDVLYSDVSGAVWTSVAVVPGESTIVLNTCIWNQPITNLSAGGRWLVGGTTSVSGASLFISSDVSGIGTTWQAVSGTGAILSQVYSLAFNGRVWIAAGVSAVADSSGQCLMRTFDTTGATGWVGISGTQTTSSSANNGNGGFDSSARSITWNSDQQMWVATGQNSGIADASFSSVIYSLDISGSSGTWQSVRESNSLFSVQGNGIANTGRKWYAAGQGVNRMIATSGTSVSGIGTWSGVLTANIALPTNANDVAFTGTTIVAAGIGSSAAGGAVYTADTNGVLLGTTWTPLNTGFSDVSGGSSTLSYEPSMDGGGLLVATGKSSNTATAISFSTNYGANWSGGTVQRSNGTNSANTQSSLFTNGGNSVAYVGKDTLFAAGGNDVHWTGKRWVSIGKNSDSTVATSVVSTSSATSSYVSTVGTMSGLTATIGTAETVLTNNNSAIAAVSDDGITWSAIQSNQAPDMMEGGFIATNSRIGAIPLINSQIVISDGGDTEITSDYGNFGSSGINSTTNGMGCGIAQIDIIAENIIVPNTASGTGTTSATGSVTILGTGGNLNNGVGIQTIASFDSTAFTITTRPLPLP